MPSTTATSVTSTISSAGNSVPPFKRSRGHWANVTARIVRNPTAMVAALVIVTLIFIALAAPWIMPGDPFAASMFTRLKPIGSVGHLLGTDELGRDLLSRLMLGGRLPLFMGDHSGVAGVCDR